MTTLTASEFEQLCFRLIRMAFKDAVKPKDVRDQGADALRPAEGVGWTRAWQAKHYPEDIAWAKCEKSLADAIDHYGVSHYTFCFPRDLSGREQKTFDDRLRRPNPKLTVDFWSSSQLQAELDGSDHGRRIARSFFADPQSDIEHVARAAAAGGALMSAQDASERIGTIGEFLRSSDDFFTYPGSVAEAGTPHTTPPPETMLSVEVGDEKTTRRIDAVPRDPEAAEQYAPKGRLQFPDKDAYERALQALQFGIPATLDAGTAVTFDQLPPLFASEVGKPLEGRIDLVPERRKLSPWKVRLVARSDRGEQALNLRLQQASEVPEGWDDVWVDQFGALTVTVRVRLRAPSQFQINYHYSYAGGVELTKHLKALRFLDALSGDGHLEVYDRRQNFCVTRTETTASEDDRDAPLLRFLEDLEIISNWAGVTFSLPESVGSEEVIDTARAAALVRKQGVPVRLDNFTLEVDEEGLAQLREGGQLAFTQEFGVRLLGRDVPLGVGFASVPSYNVCEPPERLRAGGYRVRVEPPTEADKSLTVKLSRHGRHSEAKRDHVPGAPKHKGRRRRKRKKR